MSLFQPLNTPITTPTTMQLEPSTQISQIKIASIRLTVYRVCSVLTPYHNTLSTFDLKKTPPGKSFAETNLNTTLSKIEQAIIFNSIDNIPQMNYIIAISKLILPKNIIFVS